MPENRRKSATRSVWRHQTIKGRTAHNHPKNGDYGPQPFASDGLPGRFLPWPSPAHGTALLEARTEAAYRPHPRSSQSVVANFRAGTAPQIGTISFINIID